MPVVFVIARDWTLRASLRADLRESGIEALGMEVPDDAGRAIATGQIPSVLVLEATAGLADSPATEKLIRSVPTVLIASRTETFPLPSAAAVFYRPVRLGEIVSRVREILRRGHAA
jgi:DNA-binding response OmpR family regulator